MRVPFSYIYASAAICFALMLLRQVMATARSLALAFARSPATQER